MEEYGDPPYIASRFRLNWTEYMHYLYLPIKMPCSDEIRLPQRLHFLYELYQEVRKLEMLFKGAEAWEASYVYVTARRGYATPGNPINRPGWHTDGFGTADINYIWTDRWSTQFAVQEFKDISTDHIESIQQFQDQIDPSTVISLPTELLLRLTSSHVHAAPEIPAPGGDRSFIKISVSKSKYNLLGNSHNYLFDYEWRMWDRAEIRNDPAYAGGDTGP